MKPAPSPFSALRATLTTIAFAFLLTRICVAAAAPPDFVWVESEAPTATSPAGLKFTTNGWGRADVLSGNAWLSLQVEAKTVDAAYPGDADGPTFSYNLTVTKAGTYTVWNRIGFEAVRSPIDWRMNGGAWTRIGSDAPTVDVADLQDWNPLGWLPMGSLTLTAGAHVLEIRVAKSKDAKGNRADLHYASDAIVLTDAPFHPNGALKPDQTEGVNAADRAAASHAFTLAAPNAHGAQTATDLAGDWQITADDEATVHDRLGPIAAAPDFSGYLWRAVAVPGDRNVARPEMAYVHRYWLRTRVVVPPGTAGHAVYLHLPAVNMAATVFVNGHACGFTKNNFAAWDCDVTAAIRPGETNEVAIGIKDAFYGSADPAWATHIAYLPFGFWHYNETDRLDMPVLAHFENGLLRTPSLIVAGPVYVEDVFAQPSVKGKLLKLDITLRNPTEREQVVQVENAIEPLTTGASAGGAPEKTFAPQTATVPAHGEVVVKVGEAWANPHLWWPDDPRQYVVVTRLTGGDGKRATVDQRRTKFGFREWGWQGAAFTLNGIPWHGFEDATDLGTGDAFVATYHAHHQTMHRMWGEGGDTDAQLDFFDAHGINIRRTGILDGEGAAGFYDLTRGSLWANWREQLAAYIRGQRNHPSIFIWSIENEITFINGHVRGQDKLTTDEHHKSAAVVEATDPTRPFMTDGGNALLDESFPVYGGHYLDPPFASLPEGAFADKSGIAHRQGWPVTQAKPILLGETYYAAGVPLDELATVGGDVAFVGRAEARPATDRIARMLSEGYRWNGINFDLYFQTNGWSPAETTFYNVWSPVAVICRESNWTFGAGEHVTRTVGIFNDSRDDAPLTLTATLTVGGKTIASQQSVHRVAPGENKKFPLTLTLPSTGAIRAGGQWNLTLTAKGKTVFARAYPLAVLSLATNPPPPASSPAQLTGSRMVANPSIAVYDPQGAAIMALRAHRIAVTTLMSLTSLPASARVLVVGADALTEAQSQSSALSAWAASGHVVVVLEQKSPLRYQALPGAMEATDDAGSIGFVEADDHPVFAGLRSEDFIGWSADHPLYRRAYRKPTSGGQSLVQCDRGLQDAALAQMPVGKGMLLLSQLSVESSLATSAVAQKLLLNLVAFAAAYHPVVRPVVVAAPADSPLVHALMGAGLLFGTAGDADPLEAMGKPNTIAVVSATPAHLAALAGSPAKIDAFTKSGGWLVLNGLTPEGLAAFDKLVGVDHMIRRFRQEKVEFATPRPLLSAALSTANIALGSGKRIFDFRAGDYPDPDAFGYVVDTEDIAPFGTSSFGSYANIVNNFTMADGFWPLIINFGMDKGGKSYSIPIHLPKPQTIDRFTYVQDLNYAATKRISLVFGPNDRQSFDLPPVGDPQTFAITPPRTTGDMTLEIDDWDHDPAKQHDGQDLIGVDNIYLYARRSADFRRRVRPLLNIGALVAYPRGAGGIVLCDVNFKDAEAVPANTQKKQAILATLLRNLDAPSAAVSVIAGADNLNYAPIDLSTHANQFVGPRGWFGDRAHTFADLPVGNQRFAGVPYSVYNVATSPVPTAVMLGGNGIPGNLPDAVTGIPVGRKADALFFLQAARIDQPPSADDVRQGRRFEMADYRVHYHDGTMATIPVYAGIDVANYLQAAPAALPGAQVAWTRRYDGDASPSAGGTSAVAYSMQWTNPTPGKVIDSIDLTYGPDRRGVPVLLALTAATAR